VNLQRKIMKMSSDKWKPEIEEWTKDYKIGDQENFPLDEDYKMWVTFLKLDSRTIAYFDDHTKVWAISTEPVFEAYKKLVDYYGKLQDKKLPDKEKAIATT